LETRLDLLFFLQESTKGNFKIEKEQLYQLQDNLFSSGFTVDRDVFFKWLKNVISQSTFYIAPPHIKEFFVEKIEQNLSFVHNLKDAGFQCVSDIFILVNELNEKIEVYSRPDSPEKDSNSTNNPIMGNM
jgi:hypothetical protein